MTADAQCAACGAAIAPGAKFCMACGADVSGEQSRVATRVAPARPAGKASATQARQQNLLDAVRDATLGEYEILAELGRGGMATVFLAHDLALDRKVAIKVMSPQLVAGAGMVERFKLEARTAAGLSHPHIIPIYAVRQTDDLLYFVMKFIEGRPLDSIIKESAPLPVPMVRTIVTKVGEALGYAHRRGVVHRDIKPANIMIDVEGMPIVTDFGIAKVADKHGLTMTGATIGTPTYMSPEQCNAQEITGASDQYSLGVMAYEMLTGRPLYDGDSVMTIMFKHVHDPPPSSGALGAHVPLDIGEAVVRMLQKEPGARWPTIEDALPHIGGATLAYDDTVRTQMIRYARAGSQRAILDRVSTPRSPIPVSARAGDAIESAETVRVSSAPQVPTRQRAGRRAAGAPAAARRSRAGLWIGLAVVLLAGGGGTAVVLKPWASSGSVEPPAENGGAGATPQLGGGEPTGTPSQPAAGDSLARAAGQPAEPPASPPAAPPAASTVGSVRIAAAPSMIQAGQDTLLRAEVRNASGGPMSLPVTWRSSNPGVARVDPRSGRLDALAEGRATVVAEAGGRQARVDVTVVAPPVTAVVVDPPEAALMVGGGTTLTATALGADGGRLPGRATTWRSSDEGVASVVNGRVSAVGPGTARITATSEGVRGSAEIRVTAPAPVQTAPVVTTPPPAQPPPEDPQVAIADVVRAYASALEGKNLARVRQLYPTIPSDRERQTREALAAMQNLQVRLAASEITVDGSEARARVTGQWTFRDGKLDINNIYHFERRDGVWKIVSIL